MTDMDEFFRSHVPTIRYDIPEAEREAVREIEGWLWMLDNFVSDFYAALELFDYAETHCKSGFENIPANPPPTPSMRLNVSTKWQFIAARDGAMTIHHFKKTMETTRGSLRIVPSLLEQVDTEKLKLASKLFDSYFPRAKKVRNLVAHAAETTIEPFGPNNTNERKPSVLILHSLAGRRYTTDYKGETFTYELSEANLGKLNSVKLKIFEGFDLVNIHIRKPD